jgi:hypothetical protein
MPTSLRHLHSGKDSKSDSFPIKFAGGFNHLSFSTLEMVPGDLTIFFQEGLNHINTSVVSPIKIFFGN